MRNADLQTLMEMLKDQNARKHDLIVSSGALSMTNIGRLRVTDAEPRGMDVDGEMTFDDLTVDVGDICAEGIAGRFDIPIRYYRRMETDAPALLAANVNEWLERSPGRTHLLRTFRTDDGTFGRAFLSSRYECIDHFDVALGVLDGIRQADPTAVVEGCDLTDRRMRMRVTSPSISVNILPYVEQYQPRGLGGRRGSDFPLLFAGLAVENSETGGGAFSIVPRAVVEVCTNGQTRSVDALRRVHIGAQMDEGVIDWSTDTRRAHVDFIRSQAKDAVATFLSVDYLSRFVSDMAEAAGTVVEHPAVTVEAIGKALVFTETQTADILAHFYGSGDETALGMAQAVTFVAASIDDPDLAASAEDRALSLATALA